MTETRNASPDTLGGGCTNLTSKQETREMGHKIIHLPAPGILGWDTLCGHVDRVDYIWNYTKTKATCHACLALVDHVRRLSQ